MILIDINDKKADLLSIKYLKKGKIVVLPTDTIYGFSCLADDLKAISRIKKIKRRKKSSFIILVSDLKMLSKFCLVDKDKALLIKPGNSFVLSARSRSKPYPNNGSLAIRLPKSKFLIKIIKRLNQPIISTSYNIHKQDLMKVSESEDFFKLKRNKPDLIIVDKKNSKKKPSKLFDIRGDKIIKLR